MSNEAQTWGELDAIDAWCRKHHFTICTEVRQELAEAVTKCRLEVQKERDELAEKLGEIPDKWTKRPGRAITPGDKESVTGQAITRCKDCAAWEEREGLHSFAGMNKSDGPFGYCRCNAPMPAKMPARMLAAPITRATDGCTEAPDWTTEDMLQNAPDMAVRMDFLEARSERLGRRLGRLETVEPPFDLPSLLRRVTLLESRLSGENPGGTCRLLAIEGRLHDLDGSPMFHCEGDPTPSLVERVMALEDGINPAEAGRINNLLKNMHKRIRALEDNAHAPGEGMDAAGVMEGPQR